MRAFSVLMCLLFPLVWCVRPAAGAAVPVDVIAADSRLDVQVQARAQRAGVGEFLTRLGTQYGVSLTAEGLAADLRITGQLGGVSLRQVMKRLALLLHLTWRRIGNSERPAYALYQAEGDRSAAEGARRLEWEQFCQRFLRMVQAASDPSRLPHDAASSTVFEHSQNGVIGSACRLVATLPPTVLQKLLRGEPVQVGYSELGAGSQAAVGALRTALHAGAVDVQQQLASARAAAGLPATDVPNLSPADGITVEMSLTDDGTVRVAAGRGAVVSFSAPPPSTEEQSLTDRHFVSRSSLLAAPLGLALKAETRDDAVIEFAKVAGVSTLAESFEYLDGGRLRSRRWQNPKTLEKRLDLFAYALRAKWNTAEPIALFQGEDWASERLRQIPERQAASWRTIAAQGLEYPLAVLADMAALSVSQRRKLERYAGRPAVFATTARPGRYLLLVYGALRPEQQASALRDGIDFQLLDIQQKNRVAALVRAVRPGPSDLAHTISRVIARETAQSGRIELVFRDGTRINADFKRLAQPEPAPVIQIGGQ